MAVGTAGKHENRKLLPGIYRRKILRVEPDVVAAVVAATPDLVVDGGAVRNADFAGGLEAASWEGARDLLRGSGFAPPPRTDLGLDGEAIHALVRAGSLIAVSEDFVYLPETLGALEAAMAELAAGFTVGDFRDAVGITRKHAIPLLEWMDRERITRRVGDGRELRPRPPADSPPGGAPSR